MIGEGKEKYLFYSLVMVDIIKYHSICYQVPHYNSDGRVSLKLAGSVKGINCIYATFAPLNDKWPASRVLYGWFCTLRGAQCTSSHEATLTDATIMKPPVQ